jgi:hypothetical protein
MTEQLPAALDGALASRRLTTPVRKPAVPFAPSAITADHKIESHRV